MEKPEQNEVVVEEDILNKKINRWGRSHQILNFEQKNHLKKYVINITKLYHLGIKHEQQAPLN